MRILKIDLNPDMRRTQETFISCFITFWLNSAGIALQGQKFKSYVELYKYYLLYALLLIMLASSAAVIDCKAIHQVTLTLAYTISGIFLNSSTVVLHWQKPCVLNILNMVRSEIPQIMEKNKSVSTSNEKFRTFFFSYGITYFVIYAFATMSPVIFFPLSGNKLGDANTLLIPSWFPWEYDSLSKYILTVGLQFSWLFPLSIPCLLNFTFLVYFIIEVHTQLDILCGDISKLKNHLSHKVHEENITEHFKRCIQHHQLILKFVQNFCSYYKWVFIVSLLYIIANLSLLLYGILLGEKTTSALTQQFAAFLLVFLFLFVHCFIGETLIKANEELKRCLYDIEWFTRTIKFRKIFIIFFSILQRDINLKAGSRTVASYQLFFAVVKMAYSCFKPFDKYFFALNIFHVNLHYLHVSYSIQ